MPPAIHQLVAGFSNGDAISNEARRIREVIRAWGNPSEIYCEHSRTLPELRPGVRELGLAGSTVAPDDIALLHLSIGSPVNDVFRALRCRKAILYHNITPPDFFRAVNEPVAEQLAEGRRQAAALAGVAEVNLADSAYNAEELAAWGYAQPRVLPLLLDLDGLGGPHDPAIAARLDDGLENILFVGRCAPNKRIEDLLLTFHHYQRFVNPRSRLVHVGSFAGMEIYHAILTTLAGELGLQNVDFLGSIPDAGLRACYARARAFLCLSEHEGFCIPLLEAMSRDVPVLAFDRCAVPETMDGAGVLFREKEPRQVAEMLGRLAAPGPFRDQVLDGQRQRVRRYRERDLSAELRACLQPLFSRGVPVTAAG